MAAIEATFVQGNTGPDITAQLYDVLTPTVPLNLHGCSVKFQMRKPDDELFTVDAAASIVNEALGMVSYSWSENDLGIYGEYDAQWEITYEDHRVQTTQTPNRILVRRR